MSTTEPIYPVFKPRPDNRRARLVSKLMGDGCVSSCAGVTILFSGLDWYRLCVLPGTSPQCWIRAFFTHSTLDDPSGMKNAIQGTLVLVLIASFVGVPVGMLCGIYLAEFSRNNWFTHTVRVVVDVLAGTPTILVGVLIFNLAVLPMGQASGWAGSLALAFIMCPIIARTTEEMLKLVPKALREASVGVGASRFQTLFRVVLPWRHVRELSPASSLGISAAIAGQWKRPLTVYRGR